MTEITVRQRNQVTIPKAIAEAAGIAEGTVCDMQYANGVITIRLPRAPPTHRHHAVRRQSAGAYGASTPEEIDRNIRETARLVRPRAALMRRLAGRRAYLDANVFIYFLERYPPMSGVVTAALLDGLRNREIEAVTGDDRRRRVHGGSLSRAATPDVIERVEGVLQGFWLQSRWSGTASRTSTSRRGSERRRGLPLIDALHVATALNAGCTVLVTNDQRMPSVPGLEVVRLQELEQLNG